MALESFFLEDKGSGVGVTFGGTCWEAIKKARELIEDDATCIVWGGLGLKQRLAEINRKREWIDPILLT